jgi:hypothetical protein
MWSDLLKKRKVVVLQQGGMKWLQGGMKWLQGG